MGEIIYHFESVVIFQARYKGDGPRKGKGNGFICKIIAKMGRVERDTRHLAWQRPLHFILVPIRHSSLIAIGSYEAFFAYCDWFL